MNKTANFVDVPDSIERNAQIQSTLLCFPGDVFLFGFVCFNYIFFFFFFFFTEPVTEGNTEV